ERGFPLLRYSLQYGERYCHFSIFLKEFATGGVGTSIVPVLLARLRRLRSCRKIPLPTFGNFSPRRPPITSSLEAGDMCWCFCSGCCLSPVLLSLCGTGARTTNNARAVIWACGLRAC